MLIKEKIGNINDPPLNSRSVDYVWLEWFETAKRIMHKRSDAGRELRFKFLNGAQYLSEGDIVFQDEQSTIVIQVKPCDAIVIRPASMYEMAYACYEIGNKHLPLFYENDELLIPYEAPIYKVLMASGFAPCIQSRKLLNQLRTSVSPHGHSGESKSLFSKILQLTNASNDQ